MAIFVDEQIKEEEKGAWSWSPNSREACVKLKSTVKVSSWSVCAVSRSIRKACMRRERQWQSSPLECSRILWFGRSRTDREQTEDRIVGFAPLRLNRPLLVNDQAAMQKQIKGSFELDCPNSRIQPGLGRPNEAGLIECCCRDPDTKGKRY